MNTDETHSKTRQKQIEPDLLHFYERVQAVIYARHIPHKKFADAMTAHASDNVQYDARKVENIIYNKSEKPNHIECITRALGYVSGEELITKNAHLPPAPKRNAFKKTQMAESKTKVKPAAKAEFPTDRWASMMTQMPQGSMTEEEMMRTPPRKRDASDYLKGWPSYPSADINSSDKTADTDAQLPSDRWGSMVTQMPRGSMAKKK